MENLFNRKLIFQNFSKLKFNHKLHNFVIENLLEDLETYLMFFPLSSNPSVLTISNPVLIKEDPIVKKMEDISHNIKHLVLQAEDLTNIEIISKLEGFEICIAMNCLHHVNLLSNYVRAIKSCLQKGGVFCGNFYGTATLTSLKEALVERESRFGSRVFQRFNPTLSIQSATALLQNVGFGNINVYAETKSFDFENFKMAMEFLKLINERRYLSGGFENPNRKVFFEGFGGKITLDFEIIKFYCQA